AGFGNVRHLRTGPAPAKKIDRRVRVHVLINARGSKRRRVIIARPALIGHQLPKLADDGHLLGLRPCSGPPVSLITYKAARASAATPFERKVAVIIHPEVIKGRRRPRASIATNVVAVLAKVVGGVATSASFHDMMPIRIDFWHQPDVVIVHEP